MTVWDQDKACQHKQTALDKSVQRFIYQQKKAGEQEGKTKDHIIKAYKTKLHTKIGCTTKKWWVRMLRTKASPRWHFSVLNVRCQSSLKKPKYKKKKKKKMPAKRSPEQRRTRQKVKKALL